MLYFYYKKVWGFIFLGFWVLLWGSFFFFFLLFFVYIFVFGHTTQHVGSEFPNQGLNSCPLTWKAES